MKILVHAINHAPELTGCGKYTGEMVAWLAKRDHEVKVITTFPYYPEWEKSAGDRGFRFRKENVEGATVFRCPHWVSKKMNMVRRVFHLSSFVMTSFPVLTWNMFRWRPDVVYMVAPTLIGAPLLLLLSKILRLKSWIHVQDFEVEVMLGMDEQEGSRSGLKSRVGLGFERKCLSAADRVSSISPAMVEKLHEKGVLKDKSVLFPNWVDLDFFKAQRNEVQIRQNYGYKPDDIIVLYAGNIGLKQGLDQLPELVKRCSNLSQIKFLIVGEGVYRPTLEKELSNWTEEGLVRFLPLQALEDLVKIMTMGDFHLVLQRKEVKDLVLPSKLTTILSMGGHAIITAPEGSTLANLVMDNPGVATLLAPGDIDELHQFLESSVSSPRPQKPNPIARSYAEENLGRDNILLRFEEALKEL